MKKSLIIIFIIILAIHITALIFLLGQQDSEEEPENNESPKELIPEPRIDPTQDIIPKQPPKKESPKKDGSSPVKLNKIKGGPLNFKKSVTGTIKSIPLTKHVKAGILIDSGTRQVLWSKNPKMPVPIASMTKIMTLLLVYEDIASGKIDFKQPIKVSKKAAAIGGSDIWLDPREVFPLDQLLKAVIIKSANDAAYLIAEHSGDGDVNNFIKRMNSRAKQMKLESAFFANPHGLPEKNGKDNVCSCADLVFLAEALMQYPDAIKNASTKIYYLPRHVGKTEKTMLYNTNKLVRKNVPGVDGLKTGFTQKAGSCITVTCKRNNRRLILVLAGCNNSKERNALAEALLDWGYKH